MPEDRSTRIMIVEDASLVRFYYRTVLEPAGYRVEEAFNGIEALEKLLVDPVDLLIVDINMPLMDGLTFVRSLRRRSEPISTTPVLITSTESATQDITAATAAGANFYLPKPVAAETLLEYVGMLADDGT